MDWEYILRFDARTLRDPEQLGRALNIDDDVLMIKLVHMAQVLLGNEKFKPAVFREIAQHKRPFTEEELFSLFCSFCSAPRANGEQMKQVAK